MLRIICIILIYIPLLNAYSANKYWVAATASNWSDSLNWSNISGGTGGVSLPGENDIVFFDMGSSADCYIDGSVKILGIKIQNGYLGNISHDLFDLIVGEEGFNLKSGTFQGGSGNISSEGEVLINGVSFTSTSGDLIINGNLKFISGSFNHNNGSVRFIYDSIVSINGSPLLFNLEFIPTIGDQSIISNDTIQVLNKLIFNGSHRIENNIQTILLSGNLLFLNEHQETGGSGNIFFIGSTDQYLIGNKAVGRGRLTNIFVNKSAGTLYLKEHINLGAKLNILQGNINAILYSPTLVVIDSSEIIGNIYLSNLIFFPGSLSHLHIDGSSSLRIANDMKVLSTGNTSISGIIELEGNLYLDNEGIAMGSGILKLTGGGSQNIISTCSPGQGVINLITVDKSGGTLTLEGKLTLNNTINFVNGSIQFQNLESEILIYNDLIN